MPYVQRRSRNPTQLTARQLAHLTTIPKLPSSPLHPPPTSQTLTSQPHRFDAPSSRTLIIEEVNGITRVIKDERSEGTVKGKEDQRQEGDRVDRNEHVENESNKVMPSEDEGRGRSDSIVKDITNDSTCSLRRPGSKRSESQISFEMILPESQFNQKVNDFYNDNGLVRNNGGEFYPEHEEWTFLNYEEEEVLTETGGSITERLFCVTTRA